MFTFTPALTIRPITLRYARPGCGKATRTNRMREQLAKRAAEKASQRSQS